jgi:hypothetical protein
MYKFCLCGTKGKVEFATTIDILAFVDRERLEHVFRGF